MKFGVVCNVFQGHGMGGAGATPNEVVLDAAEAADAVADIFYATTKIR